MFPNLSVYYLRCAIAGIVGGVIMVGSPAMRMQWQGLVLLLLGAFALVLWASNPNPLNNSIHRPARKVQGPSFDAGDRDPSVETPTTSRLIEEIRVNRERQKRARD